MDSVKTGSYTVEMTGIMGIFLFVIFTIMYLDFDYQSQAGLRIAGYELAVTAAMEEYSTVNATAELKKQEISFWGFPTIENMIWTISRKQKSIDVIVCAFSHLGTIKGNDYIQKEHHYKRESPVALIRNIRMLNEWKEMVSN